jgi:RNA polymerase sigma factor (sigma-70 family)
MNHWSELMRAAQDGDSHSYRRPVHELAPFLRNLLRAKAPHSQLEDVVQDTLLTIHRVRHSYDPSRPFVSWVVAIAYRRAIDAGRRRMHVSAHESAGESLDHVAAEPVPDTIDAERRALWLREAVRTLPRRQRAAVELVKLDELSIAEAAVRTGQSPGAVKVNVHRGMATLRRLLHGEAA